MQFSSFNRLARMYERSLKSLLTRWPRLNQSQRNTAANNLASKIAQGTGKANYSTWREAAFKESHSGEIYKELKKEIKPLESALHNVAQRNADLITKLPQSLREQMTEKAVQLQRQGLRGTALEAELRKIAPHLTRNRIRLIARTEISRAETDLTCARSKELGVNWYQWETSNDSRVRRSHHKMRGVLVNWDDPPQPEELNGEKSALGEYHAGSCPNCFPEDTLVSSPSGIKTLWRAAYCGDLVTVVLKNGIEFSATPNHPVLTKNGWVPVRDLNIGDDLFHLGRSRNARIQPNEDLHISSFGDVFAAVTSQVGVNRTVLPFALNFHGDVATGDVDEVSVTDFLNNGVESCKLTGSCDFALPYSYGGVRNFVSCVSLKVGSSNFSRLRNNSTPSRSAHLVHSNLTRFLHCPKGNSAYNKISSDTLTLDPEVCSDASKTPFIDNVKLPKHVGVDNVSKLYGANSCFLEFHPNNARVQPPSEADLVERFSRINLSTNVLEKRVCNYSGHVFTLETGEGFYHVSPTGIIARNCRCLSLPIISLDEITWPARVHRNGRLQKMTRAQFAKLNKEY